MFDPASLHRTGNKYADQYLNAAERLGLATEVVDPLRGMAVISNRGLRLAVRAAILGCNNLVASRFSSNKFLTSAKLLSGGFQVPDFERLDTANYRSPAGLLDALLAFSVDRFPVVVKPSTGHGGNQVFAGIADEIELAEVADYFWRLSVGELMLEKHISGDHYRVKLFDGEIIDLVARYPAFVEGDGVTTICALVARKNEAKQAASNGLIRLDAGAERLMQLAGTTRDTILAPGRRLVLCAQSNLNLGGDTERVPVSLIRPPLQRYLEKVAHFVGLRWLGLDLIVENISGGDAASGAYINETSSAHVPNDYHEGESLEQYLAPATMILQRFFGLEKTVQPRMKNERD